MTMLLSIDPGITRMGITWWNKESLTFVSSGLWEGIPREENETFQSYLTKNVQFYINEFESFEDDKLIFVVERMPFNGLTTQRASVIYLLGALYGVSFYKNIEWHEVSASTVKKTLTGDGKATKAMMRRAILEKYPEALRGRKITEVSFDEADSIAIGDTFKEKYVRKDAAS